MYKYLAYGIPIVSTIELPALESISEAFEEQEIIFVSEGKVPDSLEKPAIETKPFSIFNENEFIYNVPEVARYYIKNGKEIIIERTNGDWSEVYLFFYSNCLTAALFQRSLILFHVSGIFVDKNSVLLFAAPSGTGENRSEPDGRKKLSSRRSGRRGIPGAVIEPALGRGNRDPSPQGLLARPCHLP